MVARPLQKKKPARLVLSVVALGLAFLAYGLYFTALRFIDANHLRRNFFVAQGSSPSKKGSGSSPVDHEDKIASHSPGNSAATSSPEGTGPTSFGDEPFPLSGSESDRLNGGLAATRPGFGNARSTSQNMRIDLSQWPELAKNVSQLPRCNRILLYKPYGPHGFGAQFTRLTAEYETARSLDASFAWLPDAEWNYACEAGANWECYFEPLTSQCRQQRPDGTWSARDFGDLLQNISLGRDLEELCPSPYQGESLSTLVEQSDNLLQLWPAQPELGEISCLASSATLALAFHGHALSFLDTRQQLARERFDVSQIWRLRPEIRARLEAVTASLGLTSAASPLTENSNYIGVHIRQGDKHTEATLLSTDLYADVIRFASNRSGAKLVFVATDDGTKVSELAMILGDQFSVVCLPSTRSRTGHYQNKFNTHRQKFEEVSDLIVETEILARSAYFIGTSSSALGRTIHTRRPAEEPAESSLFLDRIWRPGTMWEHSKRYCKNISLPGINQQFCAEFRNATESIALRVGPPKSLEGTYETHPYSVFMNRSEPPSEWFDEFPKFFAGLLDTLPSTLQDT